MNYMLAWNFVHQAIYDGHLPVTRAIGYHLTTTSSASNTQAMAVLKRFSNSAEDKMTLVASFSKLLFCGADNLKRVRLECDPGEVLVSKSTFLFSMKPIITLSTADYLFKALDVVNVDLAVATATGYVDPDVNFEKIMSDNKHISKTRMFPMFSYHSVIDFVTVIPPDGNIIRMLYRHGMTDEIMSVLFERLFAQGIKSDWHMRYKEILC